MRMQAILLSVLVIAPPMGAQAPTADTAVCYRLEYPSIRREDDVYPQYLALDTANDHVVRLGSDPDRQSAFRSMFLYGATWEQHADTLVVLLSNGASGIRFLLVPAMGVRMRGRVWFLYDVIDQRPPPNNVVAQVIPCGRAQIQSEPYTLAQSRARLNERRRAALAGEEAARVHALVPPMAGTYEFELRMTGLAPITMFARTESRPRGAIWGRDDWWTLPADTSLIHATGYRLPMAVAPTIDAMPRGAAEKESSTLAEASFFVLQTAPMAALQ